MVTIPAQFNGPDESGNGGWVCGLVAEEWQRMHGPGVVEATLHQPPPLASALIWEHDGDETRLVSAGGALIARGRAGTIVDEDVPLTTLAEAEQGRAAYPGFDFHEYPRCFTCGTRRDDGDGLRLFPGPIAEGRAATPWRAHPAFDTGDGTISAEVTWAAIDCSGAWAVIGPGPMPPMLLGRMTGHIVRRPTIDEPLIASGWLREQDGRKLHTSTALTALDGDVLARSDQVWFIVDR
jgi:hypothetical protein